MLLICASRFLQTGADGSVSAPPSMSIAYCSHYELDLDFTPPWSNEPLSIISSLTCTLRLFTSICKASVIHQYWQTFLILLVIRWDLCLWVLSASGRSVWTDLGKKRGMIFFLTLFKWFQRLQRFETSFDCWEYWTWLNVGFWLSWCLEIEIYYVYLCFKTSFRKKRKWKRNMNHADYLEEHCAFGLLGPFASPQVWELL